MSQVLKNLSASELSLPSLPKSQTLFRPYIISGNLVFISGQLPLGFGELANYSGKLGQQFNIEQGQKIAQICGLNVLYHLQNACSGNLDKVQQCIKLTVFVNSTPDFTEQPAIADAVSKLMVQAFGEEKGAHSRSAIGVAQLPKGVAVEVEAIFKI